jgi:hypothetical protein
MWSAGVVEGKPVDDLVLGPDAVFQSAYREAARPSTNRKEFQSSVPGTSEERFGLYGTPRVGLTALRALVRWVSEHRNEQHCIAEPDGMAAPVGTAATEAGGSDRPPGPSADGSGRDSGGGLP